MNAFVFISLTFPYLSAEKCECCFLLTDTIIQSRDTCERLLLSTFYLCSVYINIVCDKWQLQMECEKKKSDEITIKFIFIQSFIRMKILESEPLNLSESCRGFACVCMSLPKIPSLARFSRHRSILRETILWGVKWVIWLLSKPTIAQTDTRTYMYIYIHTIRFRLSFETIVWRVLYASSTWLYLNEHWTQCEYLAVESQHYMRSNVFNTLIQIEMNSL